MISQCHLELLLCFIQVSIKHLEDSILGINFSVVILLVNLNFFFQLLGLGKSQQLSPVSQDLHPVEVTHLLLLNHHILQSLFSHAKHLLFLGALFFTLLNVSDTHLNVFHLRAVSSSLDKFS